jgi:hypothetical protein
MSKHARKRQEAQADEDCGMRAVLEGKDMGVLTFVGSGWIPLLFHPIHTCLIPDFLLSGLVSLL